MFRFPEEWPPKEHIARAKVSLGEQRYREQLVDELREHLRSGVYNGVPINWSDSEIDAALAKAGLV